MAVRGSANEIAAKWAARTAGASAEYQAGVARVTVAPGQAAAAKFEKWRAAINESQNKWRDNVAAVSLGEWQARTQGVGAQRFASGATAAAPKMEAFMGQFLPHLEAGIARVRSMPDTSLEQRLERARAMALHNAQFRRRPGITGG